MNSPRWSTVKNIIIIAAFVISLFSLFLSWQTGQNQKKQWDAINLGNIVLNNAEATIYSEVERSEIDKSDYGYSLFYYLMPNGRIEIPYNLIFVDMRTMNFFPADLEKGFTTLTEGNIIKENLKLDTISPYLEIARHFRYKLTLKNEGKTYAKQIKASCFYILGNSDEQFVMSNKVPWQLSGGEEWDFYVDYVSSLKREIPKDLKFKLKLSWIDVYGEQVNKEIEFIWFSEQNSWRWNNYGNE